MMRLLTVGHGTLSAEEFVGLLRGARAARLIDIALAAAHHPTATERLPQTRSSE
jgi:hypothetical protein